MLYRSEPQRHAVQIDQQSKSQCVVDSSSSQRTTMLCRSLSWKGGRLPRALPPEAQPSHPGPTSTSHPRTCTSWTLVGTATIWCMLRCTELMLRHTIGQTPVGLQREPCTMGAASCRGTCTNSLPLPAPCPLPIAILSCLDPTTPPHSFPQLCPIKIHPPPPPPTPPPPLPPPPLPPPRPPPPQPQLCPSPSTPFPSKCTSQPKSNCAEVCLDFFCSCHVDAC